MTTASMLHMTQALLMTSYITVIVLCGLKATEKKNVLVEGKVWSFGNRELYCWDGKLYMLDTHSLRRYDADVGDFVEIIDGDVWEWAFSCGEIYYTLLVDELDDIKTIYHSSLDDLSSAEELCTLPVRAYRMNFYNGKIYSCSSNSAGGNLYEIDLQTGEYEYLMQLSGDQNLHYAFYDNYILHPGSSFIGIVPWGLYVTDMDTGETMLHNEFLGCDLIK